MFDRLSEITLALAKKGGGGGGSTNYNDLDHKPKINNVELAGSLSLSDLGVQGALTEGTGIDIAGTTISVDADSAPTKNSQKPVTSGGTKSAIDASQNASLQMLSDTVGWYKKQLIPCQMTNGTVEGTSFAVNADGSVTLNNAYTATAFRSKLYGRTTLPAGTYKVNGKTESSTLITLQVYNNDTTSQIVNWDQQGDKEFTLSAATDISLSIGLRQGANPSNVTVYPMIRLAALTDDTFQQFRDTVDVCKANTSSLAPVENGTTASQAYAVGSHAIRNGAFITWKNAKAQGETINDVSDYTSGTVGDYIYYTISRQSITVGTGATSQVAIPVISGYTPFVVTPLINGTYASRARVTVTMKNNSTVPEYINYNNTDTESRTWDISANIIYIKS